MKTPKKYIDLVNNGIITDEIISLCLYAFNKRAKNYRDKKNELKSYFRSNYYAYDKYDNISKNEEKEKHFYSLKSNILKYYIPTCIHKQNIGNKRRIYSYQKEYKRIINNAENYNIVWSNTYYDHDKNERIYFIDIIDGEKYIYFLYYIINNLGFHQPINESEIENFNLEIAKIDDDFQTEGEDIKDLLSNQFCMKVYNLFLKQKNNELFYNSLGDKNIT